ncbi:MAG: response regulator transcription factor [Clostridia bacterium]|nr:response regulator transcription factor [Clostridia bacterium]
MAPLRENLEETIAAAGDMQVVGAAATGREITALALRADFDILLLDIEMESARAGIDAAEAILKEKPQARIIFLSIHETDEIVAAAMGSGAVDYVVKGSPPEELLRHIRAAHAGQPIMHEKIRSTVMREYTRLRKSEESLLFFIHNITRLTGAEMELIRYLLQGYSVSEIARIRVVEVVTVKTQIKGLLRKFHCARTKEIVKMIKDMNLEYLFLR